MVNLEKISDLLEKGVGNPSFQNDEGKFSAKKWKKEVQEYTEPFLRVITERLSESLTQEKNPWGGNGFKIIRKSQGKQTVVLSLQDARCKLGEPFALTTGGGSRRPFEAVILLAPSESSIEEKYGNCILWGLRWWGTTENAETASDRFVSINQDVGLTVSLAKDKALGGSYVWLFNSVSPNELIEIGLDHMADIITKDFLKLSSILLEKKGIFDDPGDPSKEKNDVSQKTPTKDDVEKAIRHIWSETRQEKIDKTLVVKRIESELSRKGIILKSDWRMSIEEKLEDWFG